MIGSPKPAKWRSIRKKLNDSHLKELEHRFREMVCRDKELRRCVCVHEAAHVLYGKRAGAIDFVFRGPTVRYDKRRGTFDDSSVASVRPIFPDKKPNEYSEQAIARMLVAGCIAECLLTESGNVRSDRMDFESFKWRSREQFRSSEKEMLRNWEAAKTGVKKDLRIPALRKELWAIAGELDEKFFG